jgi:hypothetical protein
MFIQVQETPNPNSLKFVPGVQIMESGTVNFENAQSAVGSPLARYGQVLNIGLLTFVYLNLRSLVSIVFASLTH